MRQENTFCCKLHSTSVSRPDWTYCEAFQNFLSKNILEMSSTWRLATIIEYETEVKERNHVPVEQHYAEKCKYLKRSVRKRVSGRNQLFHYWIRACSCGKQTDQSECLDIHPEHWCKTDGIEVHLKEECQWDRREQCMFSIFTARNEVAAR